MEPTPSHTLSDFSLALVREYLHFHGYTDALSALDTHVTPRIRKRNELASELGLAIDNRQQTQLEQLLRHYIPSIPVGVQERPASHREQPQQPTSARQQVAPPRPPPEPVVVDDLECEDISETEQLAQAPTAPVRQLEYSSQPFSSIINSGSLKQLRQLCLGSLPDFPSSWKVAFPQHCTLGLVAQQASGGPCGVMAALNAWMCLKWNGLSASNLIYSAQARHAPETPAYLPILVSAIVALLQQCRGSAPHLQLVWPSGNRVPFNSPLADPASYTIHFFEREDHLQEFLLSRGPQLVASGPSCMLPALVVSAILTHGLRQTQDDCAAPWPVTFVSEYSYTSQELVSLLLYGHAVSVLSDEPLPQDVQLRSLPTSVTAQIGFLSIHDLNGDSPVGARLRVGVATDSAIRRVWVVLNESHYSVLLQLETGAYTYLDQLDTRLGLVLLRQSKDGKGDTQSFLARLLTLTGENGPWEWCGSLPIL